MTLWLVDVALGLLLVVAIAYLSTEGPTMKPISPAIVALVRGAVLAALAAAAGAVALYASSNDDKLHRYWWGPLVILGARAAEGLFDKRRGQAPQAGVLGGKPANPADYV